MNGLYNGVTVGFTHFGVVEFVGNTLASHFFAEVGMNIFVSYPNCPSRHDCKHFQSFFWWLCCLSSEILEACCMLSSVCGSHSMFCS